MTVDSTYARLRLLRYIMIGLKISFFNQWEAKPKAIAPRTRYFSRALSKLQVISRNSDWFITLFSPIVIGRSNNFDVGFFDSREKTAVLKKYRV